MCPTVPGGGHILRLVLLSERHDLPRCPRGQGCRASGRVVPGVQAAAGQRYGTSGPKSGKAPSRGLSPRDTRLRTAPYGEARGFATDLLARR